MFKKLSALALILGAVNAQQACTLTAETKPKVSWSKCSENGTCSKVAGSIVLDSNWRWTHTVQGSTNCYTGNEWDEAICTDGDTCASKCCVDGADYATTYGINASADTVSLQYVTKHQYGTNIGSRVYLMEDENNYQMFNLLGNEFTFDVDVSNIGCGLNGALYFVPMEKDGGKSSYPSNKAGAKYGTGYCDAQCPRDMKWIAGRANVEGWNAVNGDANSGVGNMGTCCAEMDIWEANSKGTAFTPHPCSTNKPHTCQGDKCGGTYSTDRYGGTCDADGCDFNAWRQGDETFYGPGATVDTNKKMTVVTQFHTNAAGDLTDIKRVYVQNGVVIENAESLIPGVAGNLINEEYCTAQKAAFGDPDVYKVHGGHKQMSDALKIPQVLVMSLWDDGFAKMRWLDSNYPETSTELGASRGPCPITSGVPSELRESVPNSKVVFSNIKFGPIGSTYDSDGGSNPPTSSSAAPPASTKTSAPPATSTSAPPATGSGSPQWGQCGGIGWNGPKTCVSPFKCTVVNDYYSQCL